MKYPNPATIKDVSEHPLYEKAREALVERRQVIPVPEDMEESVIREIIADLMNCGKEKWPEPESPDAWRKSLGKDYVVCMICGEQMKLLTKAHLKRHGADKASYRRHFHIPSDVPLASESLLDERRRAMSLNRIWLYKNGKKPPREKKEKKEDVANETFDSLLGLK